MPHEVSLEVEFPLPSRPQREREKERDIVLYTHTPRIHTSNSHSKLVLPNIACHLNMMTKCWPTSDSKRRLGPKCSRLREPSPIQTNTGLHQGFPQTSTHFSVPAMGFFFFFFLPHVNTNTDIYIRKTKYVQAEEYSKKERRFFLLPFRLSSAAFLRNFCSFASCLRGGCPSAPAQSELFWRRTDRTGPGD